MGVDLLSDPGDYISEQMLAFTFNEGNELVMNITSHALTCVTFNDQKEAKRRPIFQDLSPRPEKDPCKIAGVPEFDVALPKYGITEDEFQQNWESFLSLAVRGDRLADDLKTTIIAATRQASGVSSSQKSLYL